MKTLWQDAAGIFETASANLSSGQSDIAILIDQQNGLRIVDASGWELDALRREYQASVAYTVKRHSGSVVVEGQDHASHCTFKSASNPAAYLLNGIPRHLIHPEKVLPA